MSGTGHTVQGCAHCHSSSAGASTSGRIQAGPQSQPDWLKSSSVAAGREASAANATLVKIRYKQRNPIIKPQLKCGNVLIFFMCLVCAHVDWWFTEVPTSSNLPLRINLDLNCNVTAANNMITASYIVRMSPYFLKQPLVSVTPLTFFHMHFPECTGQLLYRINLMNSQINHNYLYHSIVENCLKKIYCVWS